MTEKETLLHMIKNTKKNIPIGHMCHGIECLKCYYLNDRNICNYILIFDNAIPEKLYIEKFGYISLIEELL